MYPGIDREIRRRVNNSKWGDSSILETRDNGDSSILETRDNGDSSIGIMQSYEIIDESGVRGQRPRGGYLELKDTP